MSECISIATLIANAVAAIAAIVAIVVAIIVYSKTAKLQRKATNYSLLDDRLKLWKYLEHDYKQLDAIVKRVMEGKDWQIEKFKLLFSNKLFEEYQSIGKLEKSISDIETKIELIEHESHHIHLDENNNPDVDDFDTVATIKRKRDEIASVSLDDDERWNDYKMFCDSTFPQETDYYSLIRYVSSNRIDLQKLKKDFLSHMEDEIKASIE